MVILNPLEGGLFIDENSRAIGSLTGITVQGSGDWGIWVEGAGTLRGTAWTIEAPSGTGLLLSQRVLSADIWIANGSSNGIECSNASLSGNLTFVALAGTGLQSNGCSLDVDLLAWDGMTWDAEIINGSSLPRPDLAAEAAVLGLMRHSSWIVFEAVE